jgi:hypothetical protein
LFNPNITTKMRPLQLVNPVDLQPGKTYLIREKRPEYAHLNCKGTFVKNNYPRYEYQCTITHFTNVIVTGNKKSTDLALQDTYWNYYEADALTRAYTNHVLREITGDPSFTYYSPTS